MARQIKGTDKNEIREDSCRHIDSICSISVFSLCCYFHGNWFHVSVVCSVYNNGFSNNQFSHFLCVDNRRFDKVI